MLRLFLNAGAVLIVCRNNTMKVARVVKGNKSGKAAVWPVEIGNEIMPS